MNKIKLHTDNFGEIDLAEERIITFPHGIPGFEGHVRYTIMDIEEGLPFFYLQSIDVGGLALLVTDPFLFYPNYEFQLSEAVKQELKLTQEEDVKVYTVVAMKESANDATVNLLAPIIINRDASLAKQIILHNSKYITKHPLLTKQSDEK